MNPMFDLGLLKVTEILMKGKNNPHVAEIIFVDCLWSQSSSNN